MRDNAMLAEALRLAALGYRVFPLIPNSKKPLPGSRGVKDATTDEATIRAAWERDPGSNVGLACGGGLIVIDADPGADPRVCADLEQHASVSPFAWTPRGGFHSFFREPAGFQVRNSASKVAPGVDVRASGGYVVVAPSRVVDPAKKIDGSYEWARRLDRAPTELPDAPQWIIDALREADEPSPTPVPTARRAAAPTKRTIEHARRYLAKCDPAVQGAGGHAALLWAARVLVRGLLLDDADAFDLLVRDFNPRCDPPWEGAELEREFRHKINQARTAPYNKPEGWLLKAETGSAVDLSGILGQTPSRTPPASVTLQAAAMNTDAIATPPRAGSPVLVWMSEVAPERVRWVWPNYIPAGKITIIAGDPGLGKSYIVLDMIARVTRGASWPDRCAYADRGGAVILTCEDGIADTIRPRLDALGADCDRVAVLQAVNRGDGKVGLFTIQDIDTLREAIEEVKDCRVVMIDALSGYMGDADSHNNTEVREALAGLELVAQETGVAIVCVTHLSKATGRRAVHQVMGSLAFSAAPRAVFAVSADPDDKELRVFANVKMNIARRPPSWAYRVDDRGLRWESEPHKLDGDALLNATPSSESNAMLLDDAMEFLRVELGEGPLLAKTILARAKEAGHAKRTIERAKEELGIPSRKGADGWAWQLPPPTSGDG